MSESTLYQLLFSGCKAQYINLSQGKFRYVCFDDDDLRSGGLDSCKLEQVEFVKCNLMEAEFHRTPLSGINFTDSNITNLRVTALVENELRGAVVSPQQALELAYLLGIVVR